MMRPLPARTLGGIGAAGCASALALAGVDAKAAGAGWLAAFVFWSALCLGGLALRMMARLIPGPWSAEVGPTSEMLTALLPLAGLAVLPVLLGAHAVYPWTVEATLHGFRAVYLSIWLFSIRSISFLIGAMALAFLLATRPLWSMPLAAGGLIAFVLFDTAIMVDWLMSLEPDFHSSGFGLYAFAIQMSVALMAVAAIRLLADPAHARPELLGALMLTSLLLWNYLAFMQYFIIWSENLPKAVAWYQHRGAGIWSVAEVAIAVLNLAPTVLLFFSQVRRSRECLLAIAAAVLLARAIEIAWLVFPAVAAPLGLSLAAMILALLGLGLLSLGFLGWMARAPRTATRNQTR
jgi:hypothetical protein